ncbi:MAG: sarcosine oxidase subunit gamma [Oceanibaculum sp.]
MADIMTDTPVRIAPLPAGGKLILRADAADKKIAAAAKKALGIALPTGPLTSTAGDKATMCWLGPDEWLLLCAEEEREILQAALETGLAGQHASVVDVSDAYLGFDVTGEKAAELLAKGCSLDLHPTAFPVGRVARTTLAKADITLLRTAEGFRLYVLRSFADYAGLWLEDAAREYGG